MKKAEELEGFDSLNERDAGVFKEFLKNFLNAHGEEARRNIVPISVICEEEFGYRRYRTNLMFDYEYYGSKAWLHVKGPFTWY
ncbi:MAG: hypothetical protein AB6733_00060 [Clostridiaceae bacterium]